MERSTHFLSSVNHLFLWAIYTMANCEITIGFISWFIIPLNIDISTISPTETVPLMLFFDTVFCRVGFLNKKHLPVDRRRSSSLSWWLSPLNPLKNMSQLGWIEIPNIYIYIILYIYYILYILYILYYVLYICIYYIYIYIYIIYILYIYIYGKRKFMFQTTNQC